jgi:hypothetical protein
MSSVISVALRNKQVGNDAASHSTKQQFKLATMPQMRQVSCLFKQHDPAEVCEWQCCHCEDQEGNDAAALQAARSHSVMGVARMPLHESTWKLQLLMDEQCDTQSRRRSCNCSMIKQHDRRTAC